MIPLFHEEIPSKCFQGRGQWGEPSSVHRVGDLTGAILDVS